MLSENSRSPHLFFCDGRIIEVFRSRFLPQAAAKELYRSDNLAQVISLPPVAVGFPHNLLPRHYRAVRNVISFVFVHISGAGSFDNNFCSASNQAELIGKMKDLITTSSPSKEVCQHSASSVTSPTTVPSFLPNQKEGSGHSVASSSYHGTSRLLEIPQELRYRVYESLFWQARYTFTKLNANHAVTFKSHNLPLEIMVTCH
jgi:hypothetical protein